MAGIEAVKNLVLPGVGKFTIQDVSLVTEADLGVNFFLEDGDLGAFRAERCCKWLKELNPDVEGYHISEVCNAIWSNGAMLTDIDLSLSKPSSRKRTL